MVFSFKKCCFSLRCRKAQKADISSCLLGQNWVVCPPKLLMSPSEAQRTMVVRLGPSLHGRKKNGFRAIHHHLLTPLSYESPFSCAAFIFYFSSQKFWGLFSLHKHWKTKQYFVSILHSLFKKSDSISFYAKVIKPHSEEYFSLSLFKANKWQCVSYFAFL